MDKISELFMIFPLAVPFYLAKFNLTDSEGVPLFRGRQIFQLVSQLRHPLVHPHFVFIGSPGNHHPAFGAVRSDLDTELLMGRKKGNVNSDNH
jgi:hypothetical protein